MSKKMIVMLQKRRSLFLICAIFLLLVPVMAQAFDSAPERGLRQNLRKSRGLLDRIERALAAGEPIQALPAELKGLGGSIRTDHQTLLTRFRTRSGQLESLSASAVSRHAAMLERYQQFVSQYLAALEALDDSHPTIAEIRQLTDILSKILPTKKPRIHGSMPYYHLNLPARTPQTSPEIVPAYQGGDHDFAGADLAASPEAPISPAIADLAQSLNWNPVEMYEWVKNNIKTEWYWGLMKGADETLVQMNGNDADQAALLTALFRSAGYPARTIRGVIEFFPDIDSAREQTGLDEPADIARLFRSAGIPYESVIAGGRISNFRIEHIWVEVEIPYDNYRGAALDEHGKTWLALDTSIKAAGYSGNTPADGLQSLDLATVRDDYLAGFKTQTPLEFLKNRINDQLTDSGSVSTYGDLLSTRTINPEHMRIIPEGLQFTEVAVTGEYAALPDELLHKARFRAAAQDGTILFDQALPVYSLSNKNIVVTYEPETIEDQEIMNAYGGLDNTPLYLIHLRPLITVDGRREIVGKGGLAAGSDFTLKMELSGPNAAGQVEDTLVAGYPTVIGLTAQQAVAPEAIPPEEKNGIRLLFEQALSYIDQGNRAEDESASLLQLRVVRPLPTLITLGGVLDVVSLLNTPHSFDWKGLYIDADLRVAETIGGAAPSGVDPRSFFMRTASLQNSVLEHRIFEERFGVESVSTAKLIALAHDDAIPVALIDAANIDVKLPPLGLPEAIGDDIANAVNQGFTVTIPETELVYEDWAGYVWLKENPATSESGWMLSGEIAGGMTALNPVRWPVDYYELMNKPEVEFSSDPASVTQIKVIKGLDALNATVGQQLKTPLQVVALDRDNKRVKGVEVRFKVKAGGGLLRGNPAGSRQAEVMVMTNAQGIAQVEFFCSQSTNVNPAIRKKPDSNIDQRVDETVIEATTTTGLQTAAPITVYAFPDLPNHLRIEGGGGTGAILTWSATLRAFVEDRYNNPINGQQVDFAMDTAQANTDCASSSGSKGLSGLLVASNDPCMKSIPLYGDCGGTALNAVTGLYTGAVAQVVLGGLPDAVYPVTVTGGGTSEIVTVTAAPAGTCDPNDPPYSALVLKGSLTTDAFGRPIDGGQTSVGNDINTIPLTARMYLVREREKSVDHDFDCLPGIDTCPVAVGTGEYYVDTDFAGVSVKFDETTAVDQGNGRFNVDYPLPGTAGKHALTITGSATTTVNQTVDICVQGKDCQLSKIKQPVPPAHYTMDVFAVNVTVPQEKHFIPVNEQGYVTTDYPIAFTISPPDYTAATAQFILSQEIDAQYKDIAVLTSRTSGTDEVNFLRGFRFDQNAKYKGVAFLNKGSEFMEVKSPEMTLIPLTLELDGDLNHDGVFSEDDPAEYLAPGLVVPLNLDDDDNDGVVDNIDGYNADGIAGTPDDAMARVEADNTVTPVKDDDLVEVKLKALPASFAEGTVVLQVLQGAEKIKIWTDPAKDAANLLIDGVADPSGASKTWPLGADFTLADLPASLYVEGVAPSENRDDTAILVTTYHPAADPGREVEMDRLAVTVFQAAIVPDYNRDGSIDNDDRNKVTNNRPWRFWINDDHDGAASPEGIGDSDGDLPGQNKDNIDNKVNTIRDLIDFFPLHLDIGKALAIWPPAEGYKYILKDTTAPTPDKANLGVFEGRTSSTLLTADTVADYLEDPVLAGELIATEVKPVDAAGVELSAPFLNAIAGSDNYGIIFVEGRKAAASPLTLEIVKDGRAARSVSFPLEIVPVEEMFGHKELRYVAGGDGGDPDRFVNFSDKTKPDYYLNVKQPYCMQEKDKPATAQHNLVWLHGYNVSPTEARGTFAEIFKRFFHAGLVGRFYGVSWYDDPPDGTVLNPAPHYHQSVVNAFATAGAYAAFIHAIPGVKSIAAHSLGNLVVGEAIQNKGLTDFNKYFAVDTAVALEAYGQVADVSTLVNPDGSFATDPNTDMIRVEDWPDYIAGGQSRLLASEWYTLFNTSDNRHQLTWRNRLDSVPTGKVYNFYSSTEDVLRRYADDDLIHFAELAHAGVTGNIKAYLAISTWVKQEKFKGRRSIFNLADNFGGVSSPYCGWSFSRYWNTFLVLPWKLTPQEAADKIKDDVALRNNPFFALDARHLFPDPLSMFGPGLDNLKEEVNGVTPSEFVMQPVSATPLKNYYTKNTPAQKLVTVKDWLLAEAFPATTLPMGANYNGKLRDNNIDMSHVKPTGCKTNEDLWPRNERYMDQKEWRHSDYKDISYQYVYEFYKKIKLLSK